MKSKTFFFSKAILLGMILAAVCGALSGQTKPDARGFDSGVYDYHFRRADRETGAEQWIAEARQGIRMAKSAWELAATELYGDRALLMEAGAGIDAWSEAELEARFTQWLLTRFFGSGTAGEDAARQIRSAGLPYMYHLDENGNILYDGESGDPLVIRPGEGEVEAEQARWREEAEGIADAESSRYEARLAALFPELLAYIPEERRDAFAERLEGLAREAASGRRREFEALIAREERLLTARRTGDVWSLRKKSEGEAASMIAGQLIEEAGAFCTQGIAELQERIEAAAAGTGDLALAGSEWLDAYREQFERGIKAWEEAEERFFIRRIEWEQEAGQHYLEGEAAWSGAFTRLEQERRNWEAKAKALFESGALLFRQASEHLEAAISEAKAEFEGDALIRMEAGAGRAKAWVDSYITCGSMAAAARENIEFWLTRYPNKDAPSLSGGAFSRWIAGELASNTDAGSLATARELKQWSDLYDTYMGKAQEARDALIRDFNLVMGTGRLVDIVDEGAVSEDFNLDEYQIELIRAKAVAGYWEKRLAIAEEVIAYAEELSAGRMTEGEGIKAWEEAKARYDAALLRYDAEVSRLNAAGTGVAGAQEALYEAAASLRESESVLEEMNRSYAILMASYAVGRNDFILDDLAAKYRELLERSGLLRAGGDTAVYIRYLEQARALGFAQELESAGNTLKQLVLGGEGIGKSLSALAEAASKIRVLGEDEPVPHSIGDFGIGEDDPAYEVLKALLWEQAEQCSRAAPAEQEDIRAGYDRLIRGLVKTARAQAQTLLENRLRAMDLLTASSTADWYFSMQGREAEAAEKAAFVTRGLEFNLVRDDEEARRALLTARLTLELEGLSLIAGEAAGGGRAELLARFCLLAPGDAAECREALRELQMILDSAGDGTLQTSLDAALDAAAQGNLFISWFLREGSFFGTPSGQPLTYAFLTEELAALSRSQGLLEIYGLIGSQARAAVRETGLRALQGMGEVFRSFGVALNGEGLPGVKALADALTGRAGPVEQNLSALLSALDGHAASLPAWIRGELPAWRNALIDYIAARLAASGRTMSASGTQLAQRAEANQARIGQVEAVHEILLYAAPGSARALSAALELDPALFTLLNPDELADEAVRRIAADLAAGSGPVAPEAAEAALQAAAARYHGYAPAAIRDRAVEEAIRIITGEAPAGETAAEGDSYHELLAEELTALYGTLSRQGQRVADEYALWAAIDALQKTIAAAGQEGKSHWRSYITAEFLRDYNDNSKNQGNPLNAGVTGQAEGDLAGVKAAASWQEGLLADAYEEASQATRMLNRGFLMMASGTPAGWEEFQEGSRGYQDDPLRAWDDALIKPVEYGYYDSYYLEGSELRRQYAYRQSLEQEIQRLGAGYNKSKQSGGVIKAELEALSDTITAQQEAHSRKIGSYEAAARAFASAGAAYDGIYEAVKRDYGALEDARFAYEIQDAVRRWASTAYLGTTDASTAAEASAVHYKNPYEELSYARERYTRSDTALRALAALYDSGESRRPYADREYEALYAEYTKSFQRMLTASKALSVLEGAIAEEIERNNNYYHAYMEYLGDLGQPLSYASDYQVPADKSLRQIQDFLRIKNGNLEFAYDESFVLRPVSEDDARALQDYFDKQVKSVGDMRGTTQFEDALRRLCENMESYGVTIKTGASFIEERPPSRTLFDTPLKPGITVSKYEQWAFARDYLLRQLIENNGEIEALKGSYHDAKAMNPGENLGSMPITWHMFSKDTPVSDAAASYRNNGLLAAQKSAWESLSAAERADLELYTILTLTGGGGEAARGFSQVSEQQMFFHINGALHSEYSSLKSKAGIPFFGLPYKAGVKKIGATIDMLKPSFEEAQKKVAEGRAGLRTTLDNISAAFQLYDDSNKRLAQLKGTGTVTWSAIAAALSASGELTGAELSSLAGYWQDMVRDTGEAFQDITEALGRLARWSKNKKEDVKNRLEQAWNEDEQARTVYEARYREVFDAYIEGRADAAALNRAAQAAYGPSAPARKNHLENLERVIMNDLRGVTEGGAAYGTEYAGLAEELAGLIRRAYGARYNAELAAREQEWALQRVDLQEKYQAWIEASRLILERGRADWQEGIGRMQAAYGAWSNKFAEEYRQVRETWDGAYLAGLEDKAAWVEMATQAANNAASGALLSMVGSEADSRIRAMDAWTPLGLADFTGAEEAGTILSRVLAAGGVVNLETAAASIRGAAGTISGQVRRGTGGLRVWDAGMVQAAAAKLARDANGELAARESKRIAATVQTTVTEVLDRLYAGVKEANKDFRENMDEVFIQEGQWRRDGKNYSKNAIVHSTLFNPVISESVSVEGYRDYVMDPVSLSTDLSENRIRDLDALAIQGLLQNMYTEIEALAEEIFGTGEENAGRFGGYIGKSPEVKAGDIDIDEGKAALFSDPGSGELGRLLQDYIYWTIRESNGISAVNAAFWEKPLWDSRDSWFQAPTIRSVVDIGLQVAVSALSFTGVGAVAAIAINAGLNLADDLVFGVMDAAGGYKTWDEAGFEFGKKAIVSAASAASSGVFNGAGTLAESGSVFAQGGLTGLATENLTGAFGTLVETGMTGLGALTTGTITSALNGIRYNSRDGFGYYEDAGAFFNDWKNAGINTLSGMGSTFTGGMMNWGLEGFLEELYTGGTKLSALTGGLAAQGINYAFNDDFALNLFNLDLVTGGTVNSGLLELHLGSSGLSMGLGTGGADVSALALAGSYRGLEAWAVNARLLFTESADARRYASQMRTLYSGDRENRAEFEAVLEGQTRYVENRYAQGTESVYDEYTGVKTVYLGRDALEEGSRFGLNVLFSHEAYRNGRDDGEAGQIAERDRAVDGHITTALKTMSTYGEGSLSAGLRGEALLYDYARSQGNDAFTAAIRNAYDTTRDFWQLTATGGLRYDGSGYLRDVDGLYINIDRTKTEEIQTDTFGRTIGAKGIESGLLQILDLAANPENAALVQDMMIRSGLAHTVDPNDPENRDKWMWNGAVEDANRNGVIPQSELRKYGMVHLGGVRFSPASIEQARRLEEIALKVSAREDLQPKEVNETLETYCNYAFQDILKESNLIDASVFTKIITAGKANAIGDYFKENYRTIDGLTAQYLANMGIPVALSYINPDNTQAGHIAVVTANYGTYIPALGPRITQAGVKNGQYWARDPQTFGGRSVRPYSSYYALDKTANLSPFKSRGVLPIPRTRGGR